jgi:hypothetical protein
MRDSIDGLFAAIQAHQPPLTLKYRCKTIHIDHVEQREVPGEEYVREWGRAGAFPWMLPPAHPPEPTAPHIKKNPLSAAARKPAHSLPVEIATFLIRFRGEAHGSPPRAPLLEIGSEK